MIRIYLLFLCLLASQVLSQTYPSHEFQFQFVSSRLDTGLNRGDPAILGRFAGRQPHNGFAFSYVSNGSRISGLKVEMSFMRDTNTVRTATGSFTYRQDPLHLVVGSQFKDNRSTSRVKPFAHLMGGVTRTSTSITTSLSACAATFATSSCPARFTSDRWKPATILGGGIDIKLSDRVELRLIQVDYIPTSRFGKTFHSVRFGTGFNFH